MENLVVCGSWLSTAKGLLIEPHTDLDLDDALALLYEDALFHAKGGCPYFGEKFSVDTDTSRKEGRLVVTSLQPLDL